MDQDIVAAPHHRGVVIADHRLDLFLANEVQVYRAARIILWPVKKLYSLKFADALPLRPKEVITGDKRVPDLDISGGGFFAEAMDCRPGLGGGHTASQCHRLFLHGEFLSR